MLNPQCLLCLVVPGFHYRRSLTMTILQMIMNTQPHLANCETLLQERNIFHQLPQKAHPEKTFIVNFKSSSLNIPSIQENVRLCEVFALKNKFGQQLQHFQPHVAQLCRQKITRRSKILKTKTYLSTRVDGGQMCFPER